MPSEAVVGWITVEANTGEVAMVAAVVPFNALGRAKQRLAPLLDDTQRRQLVAAMLEDTLSTLLGVDSISRVVLLSNDSFAAELAARLGLESREEAAGVTGLNAAVQACAAQLAAEGVKDLLVVHGDLPLLTVAELEKLLQAHHIETSSEKITIVPDAVLDGSNCLLCSPPDVLQFCYGVGSFEKHLEIARQAGIQSSIVSLAGASLDIDNPADCEALRAHPDLAAAVCTATILATMRW